MRAAARRLRHWMFFVLCCLGVELVGIGTLERAPLEPVEPKPELRALADALARRLDGQAFSILNTGSMEPTLTRRDLVVTEPVAMHQVQVGDVIVFERNEQLLDRFLSKRVMHRVVAIESCDDSPLLEVGATACRRFRTQGDALGEPDRFLVEESALLGRVAYAIDGQTGETRTATVLSLQAPGPLPAAAWRDAASL